MALSPAAGHLPFYPPAAPIHIAPSLPGAEPQAAVPPIGNALRGNPQRGQALVPEAAGAHSPPPFPAHPVALEQGQPPALPGNPNIYVPPLDESSIWQFVSDTFVSLRDFEWAANARLAFRATFGGNRIPPVLRTLAGIGTMTPGYEGGVYRRQTARAWLSVAAVAALHFANDGETYNSWSSAPIAALSPSTYLILKVKEWTVHYVPELITNAKTAWSRDILAVQEVAIAAVALLAIAGVVWNLHQVVELRLHGWTWPLERAVVDTIAPAGTRFPRPQPEAVLTRADMLEAINQRCPAGAMRTALMEAHIAVLADQEHPIRQAQILGHVTQDASIRRLELPVRLGLDRDLRRCPLPDRLYAEWGHFERLLAATVDDVERHHYQRACSQYESMYFSALVRQVSILAPEEQQAAFRHRAALMLANDVARVQRGTKPAGAWYLTDQDLPMRYSTNADRNLQIAISIRDIGIPSYLNPNGTLRGEFMLGSRDHDQPYEQTIVSTNTYTDLIDNRLWHSLINQNVEELQSLHWAVPEIGGHTWLDDIAGIGAQFMGAQPGPVRIPGRCSLDYVGQNSGLNQEQIQAQRIGFRDHMLQHCTEVTGRSGLTGLTDLNLAINRIQLRRELEGNPGRIITPTGESRRFAQIFHAGRDVSLESAAHDADNNYSLQLRFNNGRLYLRGVNGEDRLIPPGSRISHVINHTHADPNRNSRWTILGADEPVPTEESEASSIAASSTASAIEGPAIEINTWEYRITPETPAPIEPEPIVPDPVVLDPIVADPAVLNPALPGPEAAVEAPVSPVPAAE